MRSASSTPAAASGRAAAGYAALRQPRGGDKHWGQMGGAEQAAVMALGWTAASWDAGDEGPLQGAWDELGPAQLWAAEALGYKSTEFGRTSLVAAGAAAADEEELGRLGLDGLEAADSSEEPVVCPNATEKLDRLLTDRDTGEPTILFRSAQLSCWLFGASACAGTFITPSLADAYELRDPLLFGALLVMALVFGPGMVPILAETRRVCRGTGEEALLPRLGAGTALLSAERHAGLKGHFDALDPPTSGWAMRIFWGAYCGLFVVTGWGVQSPWQNRSTAAVFLLWQLLAGPAAEIWTATLHIATELIAAKIDAISTALQQELRTKRTDTTAEQWEEAVVEPVRGLIRDLETLSDGWAKGVVAFMLVQAGFACAAVCVALSPTLGPWAVEQTGVEWADTAINGVFAFMTVLLIYYPLKLLAAPAALSTACDDLKEKLNAVRISDLSPEIDARLIILERAMANVNHGQGVGFDVLGIVVDKKMLTMMAVKLYAAGSAAGTALLAYSAYAPSTTAAAAGDAQCELSAAQLAGIQAAMMGRNASCAYNMTVADAIVA